MITPESYVKMRVAKLKYFPKLLRGKYVGNGQWMLTRPFYYIPDTGKDIEVPIGFISDGASIPKFAYSIIGGALDW